MIDRHARSQIHLLRRIQLIERVVQQMQNRIQALLDATNQAVAGEESALELVRGFIDVVQELRSEVASQGFDPTRVDQAIAALTAKSTDLAAAVMAGQAALLPPPAPQPAVAPPATTGTATPPVTSPSVDLPAVPQPAVAPPVDVPPVPVTTAPAAGDAPAPAPVPEMTVAPEGEVKAPDAPPPGTPSN